MCMRERSHERGEFKGERVRAKRNKNIPDETDLRLSYDGCIGCCCCRFQLIPSAMHFQMSLLSWSGVYGLPQPHLRNLLVCLLDLCVSILHTFFLFVRISNPLPPPLLQFPLILFVFSFILYSTSSCVSTPSCQLLLIIPFLPSSSSSTLTLFLSMSPVFPIVFYTKSNFSLFSTDLLSFPISCTHIHPECLVHKTGNRPTEGAKGAFPP